MIEYKGYILQICKTNQIFIRDTSGQVICEFENEHEAKDYIDDLIKDSISVNVQTRFWYICRICGKDLNKYHNYQYFDGKTFKYNSANIKYLTETRAKQVLQYYQIRDNDYYQYFMHPKFYR